MTFTDDEKARISLAFYGPTDNFFDSLFTALKTNQWAQNEKLRSALETPLVKLMTCFHEFVRIRIYHFSLPKID